MKMKSAGAMKFMKTNVAKATECPVMLCGHFHIIL